MLSNIITCTFSAGAMARVKSRVLFSGDVAVPFVPRVKLLVLRAANPVQYCFSARLVRLG